MLGYLKNLFGGDQARAARAPQRKAVRLAVEGLEERSLMAAGLRLNLSASAALVGVNQPVPATAIALVNQPALTSAVGGR